jgi:hypothetical protein
MKRYRTVVPIVFLALFSYQATGTSLVYSLSYQETAESRRAHPSGYNIRSVPESLMMVRNYSKTVIFLVSMPDAKTSRVFSDEGPYFEIIPPGMFGGPGAMVVAENKAYASAIERGGSSVPGIHSRRPAVYELALDASNKYRKLFEVQQEAAYAAARLFISPSGTKIGYVSVLKQHNIVFIHDVATGTLLKSWDATNLFRQCSDCDIGSVGWLADGNRLFFSLDSGEESGPQSKVGTYVVSEDGGALGRLPLEQGELQMQDYRNTTGTPPVLLGQSPEGNYIFEDLAQKKTGSQPQMFLVITTPERKVLGEIPLHTSLGIGPYELTRSGKFVAFSDPRSKNYEREEHVWGLNLETREEKELITLPARTIPSSEPTVTLNILGWLDER